MSSKDAQELICSTGGAPRVVHVINSLGIGGAERQLSLLTESLSSTCAQIVRPLVYSKDVVGFDQVAIISPSTNKFVSISRALLGASVDALKGKGVVLVGWMYHSWLVVLAAHLASLGRSKVLLYCRHGDPNTLGWVTRHIAMACLRWASLLKIPVVFNSESSRIAHQDMAHGLVCRVIPNGVSIPVGNSGGKRVRVGGVIGFLGRNHGDKGADRLVEIIPDVLSDLQDWTFRVSGPGMEALGPAIRERLVQLGVDVSRVEISGPVADVGEFYGDIDVLVVPSRTESFPNVVVEAAARGVIPVCIGVGEIPSILFGIVDVADDLTSLKELLKSRCRSSPSQRILISAELIERICGTYSIDVVARQHFELWQEMSNVY